MDKQRWWRRSGQSIARVEPLLVLVAAPFLLFPGRWAPLWFGLLLLPWLGRLVGYGRATRRSPMNLAVLALMVMAIVGYRVSLSPEASWARLWGLLFQGALFFAALNSVRGPADVWRGGLMLTGLTGVVALLCLAGTDWSNVRLLPVGWLYERLPMIISQLPGSGAPGSGGLFHPREVGATMAMLLPLPLALMLFGPERRLRRAAAVVVALGMLLLLLSQAIMGLFGLSMAVWLMVSWRRRWLLMLPLLLAAAAALAVAAYGPRQLGLLLLDSQHLLGVGVVLRLDMWSRAAAMIGDMPLTGIGLNTFSLMQSHFYPGYLIGPEVHAHNLLLQTALDVGLPGLLAFLLVMAALLATIAREYRACAERKTQLVLLGVAGGVVAYLASGLLDVMVLGAKPVAALWLMVGLAAGAMSKADAAVFSETGGGWWQRGWLVATIVGLSSLVLGLLLAPGVWTGNIGVLQGQRELFAARQKSRQQAEMTATLETVERALADSTADAHLHGLAGELYAWQGWQQAALDHLQQRVLLEGPQALATHAPYVSWRRKLQGTDAETTWQDTAHLYGIWRRRFPQRAVFYLLQATVYEHLLNDATQAEALIVEGETKGAAPALLLDRDNLHIMNGLLTD